MEWKIIEERKIEEVRRRRESRQENLLRGDVVSNLTENGDRRDVPLGIYDSSRRHSQREHAPPSCHKSTVV